MLHYTPEIVHAQHEGAFRVSLEFDDGTAATVDLDDLLRDPYFAHVRGPEYFHRFGIECGTLAWPRRRELAPEILYQRAGGILFERAAQMRLRTGRSHMPDLIGARHRGEYRIEFVFDDITFGTIDLRGDLHREVFEPLRSPRQFRRFYIEHGTLAWSSGADTAPEFLYARVRGWVSDADLHHLHTAARSSEPLRGRGSGLPMMPPEHRRNRGWLLLS